MILIAATTALESGRRISHGPSAAKRRQLGTALPSRARLCHSSARNSASSKCNRIRICLNHKWPPVSFRCDGVRCLRGGRCSAAWSHSPMRGAVPLHSSTYIRVGVPAMPDCHPGLAARCAAQLVLDAQHGLTTANGSHRRWRRPHAGRAAAAPLQTLPNRALQGPPCTLPAACARVPTFCTANMRAAAICLLLALLLVGHSGWVQGAVLRSVGAPGCAGASPRLFPRQ